MPSKDEVLQNVQDMQKRHVKIIQTYSPSERDALYTELLRDVHDMLEQLSQAETLTQSLLSSVFMPKDMDKFCKAERQRPKQVQARVLVRLAVFLALHGCMSLDNKCEGREALSSLRWADARYKVGNEAVCDYSDGYGIVCVDHTRDGANCFFFQ